MKQFFKRSIAIVMLVACVGMMTGCTMGVVLSSQDNELVAQYAAGVMYKHSYSFLNKYPDYDVDPSQEIPTESETAVIDITDPVETTAADETAGQEETTPMNRDFEVADSLKMDPLKITYVSYEYKKEYDIGVLGYITTTDPNNSFLIVHFELKNDTLTAVTVNTIDLHPVFRLKLPDGTTTTNSDNPYDFTKDLSNLMNLEVAARSSAEGVLLFEVTPEQMAKLDSFTISYDEKSIEIR